MLNSLMMISLNGPKPFSKEAKDLKAAVQRYQETFQTTHVIQHKTVFFAVIRELSSESTYSNKLVNTFCFTCHYCYFRWLSVTKRRRLPLTMIPKERQVQLATTGPNVREAHVEEGDWKRTRRQKKKLKLSKVKINNKYRSNKLKRPFNCFTCPLMSLSLW